MRVKTSVTLHSTLLEKIDEVESNRSALLERAAIVYLNALENRRLECHDVEIINRNVRRLNREAEDVLGYQQIP